MNALVRACVSTCVGARTLTSSLRTRRIHRADVRCRHDDGILPTLERLYAGQRTDRSRKDLGIAVGARRINNLSTRDSRRAIRTNVIHNTITMNLLSSTVMSYLRGAFAAATLVASLASNPQDAVAQPDLYVMAMSHQPEFCFQHKSQGYEGCQHPMDYWKSHLTIHGLWPEVRIIMISMSFSLCVMIPG